ncbi:MAG: lipoprotein [Pseudomonadota bacterium]
MKFLWLRIAVFCSVTLVVAACGNTGDLYFPEDLSSAVGTDDDESESE